MFRAHTPCRSQSRTDLLQVRGMHPAAPRGGGPHPRSRRRAPAQDHTMPPETAAALFHYTLSSTSSADARAASGQDTGIGGIEPRDRRRGTPQARTDLHTCRGAGRAAPPEGDRDPSPLFLPFAPPPDGAGHPRRTPAFDRGAGVAVLELLVCRALFRSSRHLVGCRVGAEGLNTQLLR